MKNFIKFSLALILVAIASSPRSFAQGKVCNLGALCSGAITANGNAVVLPVSQDFATVVVTISGTWTGTISFKGSANSGASYYLTQGTPSPSGSATSSATANGQWRFVVSGLTSFESIATAAITGSATVTISISRGSAASGGGSGGTTSPGSPDGSLQFNSGGSFAGVSGSSVGTPFSYNLTKAAVGFGGADVNALGGVFNIQNVASPSATFTGTGLNDLTAGGYFGCQVGSVPIVTIDGTGTPDTFSWSATTMTTQTHVPITGAAQDLFCGYNVTFASTTGHHLGDHWTLSQNTSTNLILSDRYGNATTYIGPNGAYFSNPQYNASFASIDLNPVVTFNTPSNSSWYNLALISWFSGSASGGSYTDLEITPTDYDRTTAAWTGTYRSLFVSPSMSGHSFSGYRLIDTDGNSMSCTAGNCAPETSAIHTNETAGNNKWAEYHKGTAPSYFGGPIEGQASIFTGVALGTPTLTVTPTCAGTCASTWKYAKVALFGNLQSDLSAEVTTSAQAATLDVSNFNTIDGSCPAGYDHYVIARTATATSPATVGWLNSVSPTACGTNLVDNGLPALSDASLSGTVNFTAGVGIQKNLVVGPPETSLPINSGQFYGKVGVLVNSTRNGTSYGNFGIGVQTEDTQETYAISGNGFCSTTNGCYATGGSFAGYALTGASLDIGESRGAEVSAYANGSGTVDVAAGLDAYLRLAETAHVTNAIRGYFSTGYNATPNVTNYYGIKVDDVVLGANRWAIKTGLGKVDFGDNAFGTHLSLVGGAYTAPTLTVVPTCSGTCATTYGYKITGSWRGIPSTTSAQVTASNAATLDESHFNTINVTCPSYIDHFVVNRSSGGVAPSNLNAGTITACGTPFVDNGIAGDSLNVFASALGSVNISDPTWGGLTMTDPGTAFGNFSYLYSYGTDYYWKSFEPSGRFVPTFIIHGVDGSIEFDPGQGSIAALKIEGNTGGDHTTSTFNGDVIVNGTIRNTPTTVSGLPTCNTGAEGTQLPVTDSDTNTWGSTVVHTSGALHVLAYCDGTSWTVMAK
jgi:hypothetical protein